MFLQLWEKEKQQEPGPSRYRLHDMICYALARRGAVGALHGIDVPGYRRRSAIYNMALGYVDSEERFAYQIGTTIIDRVLRQEVLTVMEEVFALSEKEAEEVFFLRIDDDERRINWFNFVPEEETSDE